MPLPNDPSKNPTLPSDQDQKVNPTPSASSVTFSKEKEIKLAEEKILEDVRENIEVEIAKEVKDAGLKEIKETIELPEKIAKTTGAVEVGEGVPVSTQPTLTLPLDDQKIKVGLTKSVVDSFLWLAHWCLRQIKIAKVKALKLIGIKA